MMLDVTGSMGGDKIVDLQAAAKDLIDIVVWGDQSKYTSRVALAPFAPAVNVGEAFSYTLTVTNAGPTEADAVMVHDSLPVSMTSMSTAPSQGSCTMAASVVCNLGTLAAHSNATVVVAVRPTASGTFTNTATVTSTTHDPDHGNESDSAVVVVHDADVSLTKTATPTTVTVGQDLTYTLVAANAGPGPS